MKSKKIIRIILIDLGIIVLVLSLIADRIGLGQYQGIGGRQIAGIVVGVLLIVIGLILQLLKKD